MFAGVDAEEGRDEKIEPLHPTWTPLEEKAWTDVRQIAAKVDVDKLANADAVMALAHQTINAVANRIHADKEDAVWRFTVPEALAITERVSGRLNEFIVKNIPFGETLTVSQVLQVYEWRSLAGVAERAYNLWRLVRLSNPATAITHEARERLSRAMMQWGRDHIASRLAESFVEEVGRAAIDLYGGRLKLSHEALALGEEGRGQFGHIVQSCRPGTAGHRRYRGRRDAASGSDLDFECDGA